HGISVSIGIGKSSQETLSTQLLRNVALPEHSRLVMLKHVPHVCLLSARCRRARRRAHLGRLAQSMVACFGICSEIHFSFRITGISEQGTQCEGSRGLPVLQLGLDEPNYRTIQRHLQACNQGWCRNVHFTERHCPYCGLYVYESCCCQPCNHRE